jgi:hypothetical protein
VRCYSERVADAFDDVTGVGRRSLVVPRVGDERVGRRVRVDVPHPFFSELNLRIDLVYIRIGRALALGAFLDALGPFDKTTRAELIGKQVERLERALSRPPRARRAGPAAGASGG